MVHGAPTGARQTRYPDAHIGGAGEQAARVAPIAVEVATQGAMAARLPGGQAIASGLHRDHIGQVPPLRLHAPKESDDFSAQRLLQDLCECGSDRLNHLLLNGLLTLSRWQCWSVRLLVFVRRRCYVLHHARSLLSVSSFLGRHGNGGSGSCP